MLVFRLSSKMTGKTAPFPPKADQPSAGNRPPPLLRRASLPLAFGQGRQAPAFRWRTLRQLSEKFSDKENFEDTKASVKRPDKGRNERSVFFYCLI